jgi:hypothetical protein
MEAGKATWSLLGKAMEMAAAEARKREALVARRALLRKSMGMAAAEARTLKAVEARMERVSNRGMELDR